MLPDNLGYLFDTQLALAPSKPAVFQGDTVLTFAELDARANRMAVAAVSGAASVRVWQIMSRGPGLGARRSPPEGASVGYSLTFLSFVVMLGA